MFIQEELDAIKTLVPEFISSFTIIEQNEANAKISVITLEKKTVEIYINDDGFRV